MCLEFKQHGPCGRGSAAKANSQWEFTENCTMRKKQTWVDKHRSLLKRRSSEAECYVIEKARGVSQSKEDILSLYGVSQAQMNNEQVPENIEDVIDLTDTPPKKTSSTQDTTKGRHNMYFDFHQGKVVRAWADGRVEEATTEEGDDGFIVGQEEGQEVWV